MIHIVPHAGLTVHSVADPVERRARHRRALLYKRQLNLHYGLDVAR